MSWVELTVLALGTYRITSLLVAERGPFDWFGKLRAKVGIRYDSHSMPYSVYRNGWRTEVGEIFLCGWCMSMWVGIVATLLFLEWPRLVFWAMVPFALSALSIFLQEKIK